MMPASSYDDRAGWVRIDGFLDRAAATELAAACEDAVALVGGDGGAPRAGDKPHGATRRLTDLLERVPSTEAVVEASRPMVAEILGEQFELQEVAYRCPGPGFGGQNLHVDDLPKLDDGPDRCATVIVPLIEFTESNGATRVVPGSHRRPDLQRLAATVDHLDGEVLLTGPPGTAFVFSGHLLHSGTENRSTMPRPALQITFRRTGQAMPVGP